MRRISNLLALFQDALAVRGWALPEYRRQYTPTGRISRNYQPTQRTAAERHWHDRSNPVQAARIQVAVAKRERKAERLVDHTLVSFINNWTTADRVSGSTSNNLNPFYIAK